ncbi:MULTISPECIES: hypothetical protein [unclassified Lentimicrobium]|uniref:hypothetical protein n=1 Tax=unclassified Lentimicrobium TaxID=2677434 RepID=UPI001553BBF5|nr:MULTISPECIES: hypothetical protein [unclassified Lentimicrobium]NPD47238.1 hypothetical protein [Lentimicrobium sp. S6]NPD83755.1 hypothetical protein [Lentimicrobium sp. L6]
MRLQFVFDALKFYILYNFQDIMKYISPLVSIVYYDSTKLRLVLLEHSLLKGI